MPKTRDFSKRGRVVMTASAACVFAMLGVACGEAPADGAPEEDVPESAVQAGAVETGHPAVGQFDSEAMPAGYCTATLIDPSWLVTVRHCSRGINFLTGPDGTHATSYPLTGRRYKQPTGGADTVELVELLSPVRDIAPVPLLAAGASPKEKDQVTTVGFGLHKNEDGSQTSGSKRSASAYIARIDREESKVYAQGISGFLDSGDSGGPLLWNGQVIAVANTRGFASSPSKFSTIDVAWITQTMRDPDSAQVDQGVLTRDPDDPDDTEQQEGALGLRVVKASGDLCAPESLFVEEGVLVASSPELLSRSRTQSCKLRLSASVPAGERFAKPTICSTLDVLGSATEAKATLRYSVAGSSVVRVERTVRSTRSDRVCDTLELEPDTCEDPSTAAEVPVTVEISSPGHKGSTLVLSSLEVLRAESGEAASCER